MKMEQEQTLETQESLQIIEEMIQRARFNFSQGSFYFIFWGLLLIGAALWQQFYPGDMSWIGWPIAGIIGGVGSGLYGARSDNSRRMMHLDKMYTAIWVVFFITIIFLIVGFVGKGINPNGYIMIIAGLPTLLTGLVLKFKPLQYGGVGFWILGIISIYFLEEWSSMIYAVSMLQGYLIPGFIMKGMK